MAVATARQQAEAVAQDHGETPPADFSVDQISSAVASAVGPRVDDDREDEGDTGDDSEPSDGTGGGFDDIATPPELPEHQDLESLTAHVDELEDWLNSVFFEMYQTDSSFMAHDIDGPATPDNRDAEGIGITAGAEVSSGVREMESDFSPEGNHLWNLTFERDGGFTEGDVLEIQVDGHDSAASVDPGDDSTLVAAQLEQDLPDNVDVLGSMWDETIFVEIWADEAPELSASMTTVDGAHYSIDHAPTAPIEEAHPDHAATIEAAFDQWAAALEDAIPDTMPDSGADDFLG